MWYSQTGTIIFCHFFDLKAVINKNWVSWCWQLGVFCAVVAGAIASGFECAQAQSKIIPDGTLGAESSVVQTSSNGSPIEIISGGAIRGSNLFHSFLEFNVSSGREAYFRSPNVDIQNILARVTGSNRSEILGTLGTDGNSNPNLFLINPNGIIFGQNASLNVGGSFVATTANAVLLGNNGIFSASEPAKSNLLSVNPSALLFNAISGQGIVNSSQASAGVDPNGEQITGLRVPNGRSLLLVGGDVQLDGGNLFVQDGRVELGGLAGAGTVGLNVDGNHLSLSFPQQVQLADVSITNGSIISVPASDSGSTVINADNQNILGGINITARSLALTNDAALVTATFGKGNAGSIAINARDTVTMDYSSVFSRVLEGAVGSGGDINITTGSLVLTKGTQLNTSTYGQAKAGNVTINARDTVTFDGTAADSTEGNRNPSGVFSRVEEGAVGTAGDINITTGSLTVRNGAQLTASTDGQGNAGNVTINARDTVTFDGTDGNVGNVGSSGAFSQVNSTGVGKGGTIDITTGSFALTNGAQLSALTKGQENAGNVTIDARDQVQLNNGEIFTNATSNATSAEGGNVTIAAKDIRLRNNSFIRTDLSSGQGSGGNITLTANTILALENSDILAFASEGKGGNISFHTKAFLSDPLYRPTPPTTDPVTFDSLRNNGRVDVNASGVVSGAITGVPDISFIQNSLTELPQNLINPNVLIANSCIARSSKQQGTFTITGAGGLPNRPGDAVLSTYPTGDVRSVPSGAPSRPWHKGDPIVEPQGVYHLTNGQLVLSRPCQ